jgi:hypothetical protein
VAGEDPPGQHRHLILIGQEPLGSVDDALRIVTNLERDHRAHLQGDALLGHALYGDLGLLHREREEAHLPGERQHERAVTGDNPERRAVLTRVPSGDQHRLVRGGHAKTEHRDSSQELRDRLATEILVEPFHHIERPLSTGIEDQHSGSLRQRLL